MARAFPLRPDQLANQLDRMSARLTTAESRMLAVPAAPTVQTLLLVDLAIGGLGLLAQGGGIMTLVSQQFTTTKTGTYQLQGAVDARMEAWDNTIGAPRRDVWIDLVGQDVEPHQEMPFGLDRVTKSFQSALNIALGIGTFSCRAMVDMEATNMIRIYGGWLRLTWTG